MKIKTFMNKMALWTLSTVLKFIAQKMYLVDVYLFIYLRPGGYII